MSQIPVKLLMDWERMEHPHNGTLAVTDPHGYVLIHLTKIQSFHPSPEDFRKHAIRVFIHELYHAVKHFPRGNPTNLDEMETDAFERFSLEKISRFLEKLGL